MDWLAGSGADRVSRIVDAVLGHLRRHAADPGQVDALADQVAGHVTRCEELAADSTLHLRLRRDGGSAWLCVSAVDESADDVRTVPARERRRLRAAGKPLGDLEMAVPSLGVRVTKAGAPPVTGRRLDEIDDDRMAVAVALGEAMREYPSADARTVALAAGAMLAERVGPVRSAEDAAGEFIRFHAAWGSEAEVVAASDDTLELALNRCPFRGDVREGGDFPLCQVSAGLAGQLAARVDGAARVTFDESLALGDSACLLTVHLDKPPANGAAADDAAGDAGAGADVGEQPFFSPQRVADPRSNPHLELSVSLPRQNVSVPVVRRLAAQALRAFGVVEDDVGDVQVAITEACANVIDHARDTDSYDVRIDVAADSCSITVVDQGDGFLAGDVSPSPARDAESGRGLLLMQALVDNVAFRSEPRAGAVVHMVKGLRYDDSHPLQRL